MVPPEDDTPQHPGAGGAQPPPGGPPPPNGAPHGAAPPPGGQPWQQGGVPPANQAADASGGYGQPPGGYGQPSGGQGQPSGGYGQPAGGQGQPPGQPPYGGYGGPPPAGGAPKRRSSGALWWILGAAGLVLVLVVAGGGVAAYVLLSGSGGSSTAQGEPPGRHEPGDIEGVRTFDNLSAEHTEDVVSYDFYPPAGGKHHPVWQNCGVYQEPLITEHAVHSLEHGAVWLSYKDGLPGDQPAALEELYREGDYVLVSPGHFLQRENIVAVAWGKRLVVDDADDPRLVEFLNTYVQGPQTREPGAPCSGGTSATQS